MRVSWRIWVCIGIVAVVAWSGCAQDEGDYRGPDLESTALPDRQGPSATGLREAKATTPDETSDDVWREFVTCDRLRVEMEEAWGQAPGDMYTNDPHRMGYLQIGDYVKIVGTPNSDGDVMIKVYPHDGRTVGPLNNQVWIDWEGLAMFGQERWAFTCEG